MKCKIIKDVSLCIRSTAVVTCEMILFRLKLHGDKKPDLSQIISGALRAPRTWLRLQELLLLHHYYHHLATPGV